VEASLVQELKHKAMKQAITHELLFFTNSRFSDKHFCKKKCNKEGHTCPLQLHHAIAQARILLALLGNCEAHPVKVNPAKNFIQLNVGDPFELIDDDRAINPYSFFSLKNFN